jgi:hypothetical protein
MFKILLMVFDYGSVNGELSDITPTDSQLETS